jgi:hypothetical protein
MNVKDAACVCVGGGNHGARSKKSGEGPFRPKSSGIRELGTSRIRKEKKNERVDPYKIRD